VCSASIRHLQGVLDLHSDRQAWAGTSATCCTRAHTIVEAAEASGVEGLDPALLADFGRNPDPRKWSLTSNDESGRFTHTVDAPLRSASRADRVAMASRSGSASLNIKPARVGSSTSARLSWSDASDVPGRQIGAEIGAEANGDDVEPLLHRSVPGVWLPASRWRGTRPRSTTGCPCCCGR
jgi:hypothetical protein